MASRQRSGTRTLKVVVAVAFALRLAKLLPTSFFFGTPRPKKVRVYHYTNKAGYEGILQDGHIRPSNIRQGDASYGCKVYGTELDPCIPTYTILHNNYDKDGGIQGRGENRMDRADYVFAFDRDSASVEFIDDDKRSVLCIGDGNNVDVGDALCSGKAAVAADVFKNKGKKALVYVYTNQEGYERILANGYISPENITLSVPGELQVSGVRGTLLDPSNMICTILHKMYGPSGSSYGRGKDILDRADYVFAFLLPIDMLELVSSSRSTGKVLNIGRGERVNTTEAFWHGPAAEAFDDNGLNHSVFKSEEEVLMYLQIYDAVNNYTDVETYIDVTSLDFERDRPTVNLFCFVLYVMIVGCFLLFCVELEKKGEERRRKERKGEERRRKERKGEERRGKERGNRRGKERKGEERRGKERKGEGKQDL